MVEKQQILWIHLQDLEDKINLIMNTAIENYLPDFLDKDSKNYDKSKIFTDGKYYLYDKKYCYLKARLDLKNRVSKDSLTWITWVEVKADNFFKFSENINMSKGLLSAELFSDLFFYTDTKGLKVQLDFKRRDENFDPSIVILNSQENSNLYNDYINGIEPAKFSKWLSILNPS